MGDEYDYSDYVEDIDLPLVKKEYPRDKKLDELKDSILKYYADNEGCVCYGRQLQVCFEKKYFHWITSRALDELEEEGELNVEIMRVKIDGDGYKIKFYLYPSNRYYKTELKRVLKIHKNLSAPVLSHACGRYAEVLFKNALEKEGFIVHGQHVNEYNGRIWTTTDHDLDFICSWRGIIWGVEVKNTYPYIPADEMRIKIEMCLYFGIKPLFILRWAPKSYIYEDIVSIGKGFCLLFENKIYPPGCEELVQEVKTIYPCTEVVYEARESDIKRFLNNAYKNEKM